MTTAVWILIVIFSFIIIVSYIDEKEKTKRTKLKLEAMLRDKEIEGGYKRGTYSHLGENDSSHNSTTEKKEMSREELEKGMKDLEERLKNLDTIIKNRKER